MSAPATGGAQAEQRGPIEKLLLPACLLLFILGFIARALGDGETVIVSTNAANAAVRIDDMGPAAVDQTGSRFLHVPRGTRRVAAAHEDFVPAAQDVDVHLFGANTASVKMEPIMIPLEVQTEPRAQVLLNGKVIGTASDDGLLKAQVASGIYTLAAQLSGYESQPENVAIRERSFRHYAQLRMTEAKRQELVLQQERAEERMQQARLLFAQRNYSAALRAAEEAIKLAPQHYGARQLRDQIAETISILQ